MTRLIIGSILGNYPFTSGPRIAVWHVPSPIKLGESITATVGFASLPQTGEFSIKRGYTLYDWCR